jgi:hypothetical protein
MADVDSGGGGGRGKKGGSKTKKKSTRIDMTAMVDVAFLLLTFFVLTATMQDFSVMTLTMPPKADDVPEEDKKVDVDEEKVMTLILGDNDKVTYYWKITNPDIDSTTFAAKGGIRDVIMNHLTGDHRGSRKMCRDIKREQRRDLTEEEKKSCWDPIFIIKPRYNCKYRNLVDLLDEMAITEAPKYAIDKFTEKDSLLILGELDVDEEIVEKK